MVFMETKNISLKIKEVLYDKLKEEAKKQDRSLASFVRHTLKESIKKR